MAILDKPMGKLAKTLTSKFGRSATLKHVAGRPLYNTATGTVSETATSISCTVVFGEFTEKQIDGTLVKQGDRKAVVSRLDINVEPAPDKSVLIEGGRTWKIVRVIGYSSGAQEAAYELHVRR